MSEPMTKRTKQAMGVVLATALFIIGAGITVGILTSNILWGLLGSVLALVAVILVAVLIVVAYAVGRAFDIAVEKQKKG